MSLRNDWKYGQDCLCDEGKIHAEVSVPEHGWHLHSGQCCGCVNIRVYRNGANEDTWATDPDYAEQNSDQVHICDLPAFIATLQRFQALTSATRGSAAPQNDSPPVPVTEETA